MKIEIRKARREEISVISFFQIKMAKETEDIDLEKDVVFNGVTAVFDDESKGVYWVAEKGNEIIASMLMTPEWSDWRNKTVLWFQSVYVLKEYRGQGIFRLMYEKLAEIVNSDENIGGLRLYVDKRNVSAQKVYEKLGMDGEHYRFFEWMKEF